MNCPVADPRKARDYYYRLIAENAINGGAGSNPYYNRNDETGQEDPNNPNNHNKLCCYSLDDNNYMDFSLERREEKIAAGHWNRNGAPVYSGICGLSAKGGTPITDLVT